MARAFNSDNELWTEVNTLIDALDDAANLTALEQAKLAAINAKSSWDEGDISAFCDLLHASMLRATGTTD